jgi:hypothetical protein
LFDEFLRAQGKAFQARVVAIEINSTYSACSNCTSVLIGIREMLDKERAPIDPKTPSGPKIAPAALTFSYSKLYVPDEKHNASSRQAGQTTPSNLSDLRKARWYLSP